MQWEEAPPQVNVLDWRKRASSYGLRAPADGDEDETAFERAPEQLIGEEDPEAFEAQPVEDGTSDDGSDQLDEEPPEQGVYGTDVDLVRRSSSRSANVLC